MQPEQAFGIVLRDLRRKQSLSQEMLALESRLDRTFISLLERGLRQPSLTTILQISEPLGVAPQDLVASVMDVLAEEDQAREAT